MPSSHFGDSIRKARKAKGLTQRQLADAIGVDMRTIGRYEAAERYVDVPKTSIVAIQKALSWAFFPGDGEDAITVESELNLGLQPVVVFVDYFDVAFRGGTGETSFGPADQDGSIPFNKSFLEQCSVDPKHAACVRVVGDSMSPTLRDGDFVVLDLRRDRWGADGVYALRMVDDLMIKRVQKVGGRMILQSDNPRYSPIEVAPDSDLAEQVELLGLARLGSQRF